MLKMHVENMRGKGMQGSTLLLHFFYLHRQRKRLSVLPQLPVELSDCTLQAHASPVELVKKWYLVPHTWPREHTHTESVSLALSFPVLVHTNSYLMSSVIICQVHLRGLTLGSSLAGEVF